MVEKINNQIDTPKISLEQAKELFSKLFENNKNREVVAELFKWIPWMVREQEVQDVIKIAKWWVEDLKNTV